jgi:hypothetical protein
LNDFYISEEWAPADFSFKKGLNEGYFVEIDAYNEDDELIGKLDFKFLHIDGAKKMIKDILKRK